MSTIKDPEKWRRAYVVQHTPRHDFSALREIADNIVFISNGYESEELLPQLIKTALLGYDPTTDIIVPVGNVIQNILTGLLLSGSAEVNPVLSLAIWQDGVYRIRHINIAELLHVQ